MKKIKLCLIAFFAIVFASMSCAFVATSVKHAEAAATVDEVKVLKSGVFAMDDSGLTLRTNDNVGIRFKVKMGKNLGVKIKGIEDVSLKFLIAPRVVVDSVNGDYSKLVTAAENATEGQPALARISVADKTKMYEDGGYYWASLVIAKTTGTNIKLDMNVVAYITYTDENSKAQTRYATTNVEKVRGNLYNVVNSCAVINEYATDIIGNENFNWYGTETYPIKITTDKQAADLKKSGVSLSGKTVLSSVEFTGTEATVKTVTESFVDENRQEIVLGGNDTYAIESLGVFDDGTVEKATIGGVAVTYDNKGNKGNITLSSEFKNRLAKHGEQILSVTVKGADGNYTEYKKKLLVVTKEISSFEELKAALKFNANNVKYGYYRLATDLIGYGEYQSENGIADGIWKNPTGELGFRGTFDGNNLSIRETFYITGLFGYIGKGAVIKNITFNMNKYADDKQYMLLGYSMVGATLENVKVNVTPQTGDGRTEIKSNGVSGLLTSIFANGNTFKKVVVDARDTDIDTLFGSCAYYGYTGTDTNTFDKDCKVVAKSLLGLACINNAEGVKKTDSAFISGSANLTVAKVGAAKWFTNEIVLSSNTEDDKVNLKVMGDYTNAAILPVTFGGEAVGKDVKYDNGTLTLTNDFKNNKKKHGIRNLCLIAEKDGKYYNIKTQVTVITKEISDINTLTAALTPDEGSSAVYGYYRLSEDLNSNGWYSVGYAKDWTAEQRSNPEFGFRGTFDGNGKKITSWFWADGLFGVVGKGAVIKNLTIDNKQYYGGNGNLNTLFGYSMMGASMDKVTVNILSGGRADIATDAACGLLTGLGGYGNTLKDVTINAVGLDIDTLFGTGCWFTYPEGYAQNTFENCSITAKSLIGLACTDNAKKTVTSYDKVSGLTVTLGA